MNLSLSSTVEEILSVDDASKIEEQIPQQRLQGYIEELEKQGIKTKTGKNIEIAYCELQSTGKIQYIGSTKEDNPKRVGIFFAPDYKLLDKIMVDSVLTGATKIYPKLDWIFFCAFQFDPEAHRLIDEASIDIKLHKVNIADDLLNSDLKKKQKNSSSFTLVGQPEVELIQKENGEYQVEVKGFDFYNVKTDEMSSGGTEKIALWMLDTNYNGRILLPKQIFFSDSKVWDKLKKELKAEIESDYLKQSTSNLSLPFAKTEEEFSQIAVKIIDMTDHEIYSGFKIL